MRLEDIYTELIAEESRNPENRRHLDHPTQTLRGHNPSCGDEITLELFVEDGIVKDASFTGIGCAISQASTSMMINVVKGKRVDEAKALADLFIRMIQGEVTDDVELEPLEDAAALKSIATMPARVKCAVLSWRTLDEAIKA